MNKTARKVAIAAAGFVVLAALIFGIFVFQENRNQQSAVDYWILDVSTSGGGTVVPNGTLHVPLNQSSIDVAAHANGWNSFMDWTFDGEKLTNQSSTITVPRQQANSSHALKANFITGTPPIYHVIDGEVTVNASSFQVYTFTVPSNAETAITSVSFSALGNSSEVVRVLIMDQANFTRWENSSQASPLADSGQLSSGEVTVTLHSGGTLCIVLDNTFDSTAPKHMEIHASFGYIPKN
jgi:hypothetical protein